MGKQDSRVPADKALNFYLYQKYSESVKRDASAKGNDKKGKDNDSLMCVQIVIPKEMQKKYYGAQVFFSPNGVDFPDLSISRRKNGSVVTEWYSERGSKSDRDKNYICDDNCIYIEPKDNQLSGCGIIAFVENDFKEKLNEKNFYKFIINYAQKETISYRIVEKKSSLHIQVLYPLLRENIKLGLVKKGGAKPIMVKDFAPDPTRDERFTKQEIIELKANGRKEDVTKKTIKIKNTNQYDYRLTFLEERHAAHYLLVDESDYTIEDQAQRKKEIKLSNKIKENAHRCPYCGRPLVNIKYQKGETAIVGCDGKLISNTVGEASLRHKLTRVCSADLVTRSKQNSRSISIIQKNRLIIPDGYDELPSMNVVVAGFPDSGKTIFLSSIFDMHEVSNGQKIKANSYILQKICKTFDKKLHDSKGFEEIEFNSLDDNFKIDDTIERERWSARGDIKTRYLLSAGKNVEAQSPGDVAWKLSWQPIGFKLGDLGSVYFYDVPGEMFEPGKIDKVRALDMADCLIAVIDGSPKREDPVGDLVETLEKIPRLSSSSSDKKIENMPIAIVYTKHDLKLTDYLGEERNKDFCFDENCHVVRENIIGMLPKNGKYEGSALERHIDCSSYELEQYLKSRNNNFNTLKQKYKNIKFFTCSALGSSSCLSEPIGGEKEVLFKPRKLRVELPIIWLMYKKGLIKE